MSYTYHTLLAATGLRINALGNVDLSQFNATDAAGLQVVYTQHPLTNEMFGSSIFPFNSIRDAILNAEQKLCQAISRSTDRVLRSYIRSQTTALNSGAELPKLDVNGVEIIGNFGAVIDVNDPDLLCTRQPVAVIRRRLQSPDLYLISGAQYALDGTRIIHTQTQVVLECCVYNQTQQQQRFDADEAILLPDVLAEAYINGALAMLVRDDEFTAQAQIFAGYFTTTLATLAPAQMEAQPV